MGVARVGERDALTCMYFTACTHSNAFVCTMCMLTPAAESSTLCVLFNTSCCFYGTF